MNEKKELKEHGLRERAVAVRSSGGTPPRKQLPSMAALYSAPSVSKRKNYESSTDNEDSSNKKRKKKSKKKKPEKNDEGSGIDDYEKKFIQYIQKIRRNNAECNCGHNLLGKHQSTQTFYNEENKQEQSEANEV